MVLAYFNLNNVNTFRMLAIPRIQIFKNNSLLAADRWPLGGNWTAAELRGLDIIPLIDQGISYSTNVNDLTALYQFRNRSAGSITGINIYCDWRMQQLQGGT